MYIYTLDSQPPYIVGGIVKTHCGHSLYIPTNYTHCTFPTPHMFAPHNVSTPK
jgi:hypothetical protein